MHLLLFLLAQTPTDEPFRAPEIVGNSPQLPIPTVDIDVVGGVALGLYNILNQDNILLIILGILAAFLVLAWVISVVRNPPE